MQFASKVYQEVVRERKKTSEVTATLQQAAHEPTTHYHGTFFAT
jgi:hypothetical protein